MATNFASKLLAILTSCGVFYQSTIASASIRVFDDNDSGSPRMSNLGNPSNPGNTAPHFPDSTGIRPGASLHDLVVGGFQPTSPQPHIPSLPDPGQGKNYEDALIEAFFDKGGVATVCMERVRTQGVQGISSLAGVNSVVEERLTDLAFRSRGGLASFALLNEISSQIALDVPPPLKGKNACNGGYELERCYALLEQSLSNRHQARYSSSFHPNLFLEWQDLKRDMNPFDPSLLNLESFSSPEENEFVPQTMSDLNQDQADELMLDLSLEIVAAIDFQAAYGDKEKVDRLRSFLARVNPSAAMAIDCILKNHDITSPHSSLADWRPSDGNNGRIVGPLSGAVYFSRDRNGELTAAPLLIIVFIKGGGAASGGGAALTMAQATIAAAIVTTAGYGMTTMMQMRHATNLAREKMAHESAEREKDRQLEREKMAHENAKNGNDSDAKEAPVTEKTDLEIELEENIEEGKDSVIKTVDDVPGWIFGQDQILGNEYQLAALKSQIRLENGQSIEDAICPAVHEHMVYQIENELKQESRIRVTQETSEQLLKEKLAVIEFESDLEWNAKNEEQLRQCSQVYLDEGVR